MARVTLQTIADRLGVSRMTVSNAFSRPDQLSADLRQKILAAAADLGYAGPDPAGRALARGTAGAVGVLLTDELQYAFVDEVATSFLAAVVTELAPTGLALTLLTPNGRDDVIPARDVALDGAIVYSCKQESTAREWLVRRKLPLVYVDQDPVPDIASVNVDDRAGARAAAQHLLDLGHRRIGSITGPLHFTTGKGRYDGMMQALQARGVTPLPEHVRSGDFREGAAYSVAREVLERPDRPSALYVANGLMALGVMEGGLCL